MNFLASKKPKTQGFFDIAGYRLDIIYFILLFLYLD
jgi:hypothetical protein